MYLPLAREYLYIIATKKKTKENLKGNLNEYKCNLHFVLASLSFETLPQLFTSFVFFLEY